MSRPIDYTHAPPEFIENLQWVCALDAFDFCDPEPLATLVQKQEIPKELRPAVSDIIAGTRKPNRRRAAASKFEAISRMEVATSVSFMIGLWNISLYDQANPAISDLKGAHLHADVEGIETTEAIEYFNRMKREHISEVAAEFDVSEETVENLLRDFRKKIRDYPDV